MATGLAYEQSDMDFALCGLKVENKEKLNEGINKLSKQLSEDPLIKECKAIPAARVPVIKLVFFLLTTYKRNWIKPK